MLECAVIVICLNEAACIGETLESLTAQTYPKERFDILVVDGGSTDGTQEVVRAHAERHPNLRLVVEPKQGAAAGRNAGVRATRRPYVAFLDGDCVAPPDWLMTMARGFTHWRERKPSLAAVGGSNVAPPEAGAFVQALSVAQDTFLGSFNSVQGRRFCHACCVESVATANALYDKSAIEAVGGFDETLRSEAEDADLNYRIRQHGGCFIFLPESRVMHWMRATPAQWWRNMVRYGRGRARLLKRHPGMRSWIYALPLLFACSMALLLLAPWWSGFLAPLLYFPAMASYVLYLTARKGVVNLAPHVFIAFVVQHFGYSLGEAQGLLDRRVV